MEENRIAEIVLDASFRIHKEIGPGAFESVYESVLEYELSHVYGLDVRTQSAIPVIWKEVKLELGFRADMIVENKTVIEIKSIDSLAPIHAKQVLTYLKLTKLKLGLLINFNEVLLKNGIRRLVNNL